MQQDQQEDEEEEEEEVVCKEDSAIVKGAAAWPELADGAAGAALRARRPTLERNMVQDNPSSKGSEPPSVDPLRLNKSG